MNKKLGLTALGAAMAIGLTACGGEGAGAASGEAPAATAAPEELTIGVSMPTQTSERWIADGNAVKSQLEEAGYKVELQYANDDIPTQGQQIDQMLTQGADLLIVAAIDGTALSSQLQAAADQNVKVISYDRLIRETENVDFYVSFDNFKVGVAQGTALLTGLGVLNADGSAGTATGPFNVELFAGSLDDNNAGFFFDGAMSVLQPKIDDGTRVDGVLSPYDGLSRGIITALQNAGYGPNLTSTPSPLPVVTGQDAEIASVKLIADGTQFATIFKDTRKLAEQAVTSAESFLAGEEPEANDTETYDNGVKVVPSFLLESDIVYADNIQSLLIDTEYWTEEQVASGQA